MKKIVLGILIAGAFVGGVHGQSVSRMELKVGGECLFPSKTQDWGVGYGASAELIFWHPCGLGLALTAGFQQWNVNDDTESATFSLADGMGYSYADGLEGDATLIPLGVSGLYKIPVAQSVTLTLEGGLRYVFVNSNVEFVESESYLGADGNTLSYTDSYETEFDNGVVGMVAADLDVEVAQGVRLFAGAGYQFDIMKGDSSVNDYDLEDENELSAIFVRAGLAFDL